MMQETQNEKRSLRYEFTAGEIYDLSHQLASKTKELESVEKEKVSVTSQYTAKSKKIKSELNVLSNQVSDGWELRDIECEVIYHQPTQGKKTIIRKDTNKLVAIETMQDYEWNLFNQPEEEDPATEDAEVITSKKKKRNRKKKNQPANGRPLALPSPEDKEDEVEFEEIASEEEE